MVNYGIQSYRKTDVVTADPKKLILMCYEGVIDQLKLGLQCYREGSYEKKTKAFSKARDIISELICSLDFDQGGAIARNLDALYNYMLRQIDAADINRDLEAVEEVIRMSSELKSAWEEIIRRPERELGRAKAARLSGAARPAAFNVGNGI